MHDNVISFVKSLSVGPCSCSYRMGSASSGHYMSDGTYASGHHDPGPKTECMRCKARRCLDADGVEYVKDDRAQWIMTNCVGPLNACAAPMSLGEVFVTSGTYTGGLNIR